MLGRGSRGQVKLHQQESPAARHPLNHLFISDVHLFPLEGGRGGGPFDSYSGGGLRRASFQARDHNSHPEAKVSQTVFL